LPAVPTRGSETVPRSNESSTPSTNGQQIWIATIIGGSTTVHMRVHDPSKSMLWFTVSRAKKYSDGFFLGSHHQWLFIGNHQESGNNLTLISKQTTVSKLESLNTDCE
jgi:hypothetical protein